MGFTKRAVKTHIKYATATYDEKYDPDSGKYDKDWAKKSVKSGWTGTVSYPSDMLSDKPAKRNTTKRAAAQLLFGTMNDYYRRLAPEGKRHVDALISASKQYSRIGKGLKRMTVDEFHKFVKTIEVDRAVVFNFARQDLTIKAVINKNNLVLKTDPDMIGGLVILKDVEGNKHFFGVGDIMTIMAVSKDKPAA